MVHFRGHDPSTGNDPIGMRQGTLLPTAITGITATGNIPGSRPVEGYVYAGNQDEAKNPPVDPSERRRAIGMKAQRGAAAMSEWTQLALKVAKASEDATVRGWTHEAEQAMLQLSRFITQTARRVHAGHGGALRPQNAADFVSAAPGLVWKKLPNFLGWYERELDPVTRESAGKDFFAAWCYRELEYRYLDHGRTQAAEDRDRAVRTSEWLADPKAVAVDEEDGEFSLSPAEARKLASWDALDGVILFCLAGQWDKVPQPVWDGWVSSLGFGHGFPPTEFVSAPPRLKRQALASALGVSRDVIYQRWLRLKRKFEKSSE